MAWVESTADFDQDNRHQLEPFEVINEAPNRQTSRVRALTGADSQDQARDQEIGLKAFKELFEGESTEERLGRLAAFESSWQWLKQQFEVINEAANSEIFQKLAAFVFERHKAVCVQIKAGLRHCTVPTALAVAGSINPADHAETLPSLHTALKSQGCFTAILGPIDFVENAVAPALNSVLRQFSGLDTKADDMLGLQAWYSDEAKKSPRQLAPESQEGSAPCDPDVISPKLGHLKLKTPSKTPKKTSRSASAATEPEAADSIATPFGKMALKTPQTVKLQPRRAAADSIASPFGQMALKTPQTLKLRPRRAVTHQKAASTSAEETQEAHIGGLSGADRPLVVIVEDAEGVNPAALNDFVIVLSENHPDLPVVLVLGMSTSAGALDQILPTGTTDMLAPRNFLMVRSLFRLEALFRKVLLSEDCRLIFGHALLRDLDDSYMRDDFTVNRFLKGLQLACRSHFQFHELSALAAVPEEEIAEHCKKLSKPLLSQALSRLKLTAKRKAFPRLVSEALEHAAKWKLSLLWVIDAAAAAGFSGLTCGLTARQLYMDASVSNVSESEDGRRLIRKLKWALQSLEAAPLVGLLRKLLETADGRKGAAALPKEVASAQALVDRWDREQAASDEAAESIAPSPPAAAAAPKRAKESGAHRRLDMGAAAKEPTPEAEADSKASTPEQLLEGVWNILETAFANLDCPPSSAPGATAFWVRDGTGSRKQLSLDVRGAVHRALTHPEDYFGGHATGISSQQNDTSNAYQLLLEYGEEVDVNDWFANFCCIYKVEVQDPSQSPSPPKKAKRGRAKKGSKKVLQDPAADEAAELAAAEARAARTKQAKLRSRKADEAADEADDGRVEFQIPLPELVSRFTQATNDLQLMGIVKPALKKKGGVFAQRLVWPAPSAGF